MTTRQEYKLLNKLDLYPLQVATVCTYICLQWSVKKPRPSMACSKPIRPLTIFIRDVWIVSLQGKKKIQYHVFDQKCYGNYLVFSFLVLSLSIMYLTCPQCIHAVWKANLISCGGCAPRVGPGTMRRYVQETEGLQTELPDPLSQILPITL